MLFPYEHTRTTLNPRKPWRKKHSLLLKHIRSSWSDTTLVTQHWKRINPAAQSGSLFSVAAELLPSTGAAELKQHCHQIKGEICQISVQLNMLDNSDPYNFFKHCCSDPEMMLRVVNEFLLVFSNRFIYFKVTQYNFINLNYLMHFSINF